MILRITTLILFIQITLLACASGWSYHDKQFVFLEERNQAFSNFSGNLKDAQTYNEIYMDYERRAKKENISEWSKQLNQTLSSKEVEEIVYKRKNLEKVKNKEILDYLSFVEKQEKLVTNNYYYNKEKDEKKIDVNLLINKASKKIDSVKSSYLKLRYFYLALRLAHYKNKQALDIYDKYSYLLKEQKQTIVKDWIHALYAGILVKDKQTALGVYEFTKLLNKDRINWHLSFYNFHHINSNELWDELYSISKNKDEKTKLYALRALNTNSNIIEELENIRTLDKNSKWYDFILYRQLLYTQHYFDEHKLYERDFQTKKYITYLESVKKEDMYLVHLSLAYFYLYDKQIQKAEELSKRLTKEYNNHETQTLSYIIYLNTLKEVDYNTENVIYEKMSKLLENKDHKSHSIHDYTFVVLTKLYKKQNDKFKTLLSKSINYLDSNSFDLESIEKLQVFSNTKKQSKLEEYFQNKYLEEKHIITNDKQIILSENLKKAYTKILINNLKFKEALEVNSTYLSEKIKFNPFNVKIKGNNRSGKQYTYTVKEFLEKLLVIKNELKKNPNSIMDNYLYANALYNLSYFGNSNILSVVYRSVYSFPHKNLELKKINDSIKYYKIAINHSTKAEFKAKITYMLAKSELVLFDINNSKKINYYNNQENSYEVDRLWRYMKSNIYKDYIKKGYGKYFDKLEENYSNTKYYKELIKECANLKTYQREKN